MDDLLGATWARRIGEVRADLLHIGDHWPDLYQLRMPGTRRRRARRPLDARLRRAADELVRTEKAELGASVLGASRAPMELAVLDVLSGILMQAVELADRMAAAAGTEEPVPPSTAYDFDALGRVLAAVSQSLPAAAENDYEALDDAQETARRMRRRLDGALGDIVDGQVLSALCAWCHGATPATPVGGQATLTVRLVAGELVIVCENELCDPPGADCGTWVRGKPAWIWAEWEWLSRRLEAAGGGRMTS